MAELVLPTWFVLGAVVAYGVVFGSFLNVVIHRLPRGQSLVRPRSSCPACGALIRWHDNVPLLSWLVLRGRCRSCRAPISPRYPLVEAATAALMVGVVLVFGLTWSGLAAALLALLLLPLALIDLEHHLLPDALTLPGLAAGLLLAVLVRPLVDPLDAAVGALLGAALPYGVMVAYKAVRGVEGMGLGDVKLLAMIGAFLGWRGVLLTLALGSVAGALVGLALITAGRGTRETELPFGTFLAAGALVVLFTGAELMRALGWVVP